MNGHGVEQDMNVRPTFKTKAFITNARNSVIEGEWVTGQTDSDVVRQLHTAYIITGTQEASYRGATAYDSYMKRHGAYRWSYEGRGVNVTLWAVREYK